MNRTGRAVGAAAIAAIVISLSCTDLDPQGAATANTVVMNTGLTTIMVGQTVQANAAVQNALGASIDGIDISYSSTNPAVATISGTGLITGVAPGTTDLVASAVGKTASVLVTVVPVAPTATTLSIATQLPTSAPSGATLAVQPAVQVQDAAGVPVAQAGVIVTASIGSGGGTLGGFAVASTNANGLATFTGLSISGTVGPRTLTFSAPGFPSVTSEAVDITAGAPAALVVSTQPSATVQSAVALAAQPVVQLRDASGNPVGQDGLTVTATIATGGGTLGGTAAVITDVNGVASFTNLSITGTAGSRTLGFAASGLTSAVSTTIDVTPGTSAPSAIAIMTQPSAGAQSGVALAQQPVVQIRDGTGAAVNQAGVSVTAAIATGGGSLGGTTTVTTNGSGVATFTDLSLTGTVGPKTLEFTSGTLAAPTSNSITLSAGAPSAVTIATQPSITASSGVAFGQQPAVQVRDASGNPVRQAGLLVTASIESGGGTLAGAATATTNANGVATFTNLSITGEAGPRTLSFASGLLSSAASNPIDITDPVVTPAALTITTQPSPTANSGLLIVQQPVLQVRDGSGNAVNQAGISVTAAIASGGGTLSGIATVVTNALGVATFTNLAISGTAPGERILSFTSGSLTPATSNPVTVSVGPVSAVTVTAQPSATAQSGTAFGTQPAVQIRDGSGNPVNQAGIFVTADIASGGGTLGGAATVGTNASGVATFTDLSISGNPGPRALSFSSGSLAAATSSTIDVTGPPTLSVTTEPSPTAQSGAVFAQQPVIQLRDASGAAMGLAGVSVTASISNGGGTLGGTATAITDAAGVATFSGLSITGAIGGRTLSFTATGFVGAASAVINITAGPAAVLSISTQPSSSAASGAAFAQQPIVRLRDGSGNVVSQAGVNVTVVIASGGGAIGGTTTIATDAGGIATFTNLSIIGTIGARTLRFSASGFPNVTSSSVNITAGTPSALSISTQPGSTATSGAVLGPQPVIRLVDASGNAASQGGVNITAAIGSGAGTLSGTMTVATNASGVATFTNLVITGAAGARTLTFSAPGLGSVASATITVSDPPVGLDAEPTFDAGSQVLMWQDEFDGYGTFTDIIAAGWRTANGASTQDVTTNAGGANLLITPGFDGTGKAIRLRYDGISNGSGQEGHSWSRSSLAAASAAGGPGDVNAGKPGKAFYISYYFRIVPGGGHPLDSTRRIVKVKWLELWNSTDGDRAQFSSGYAVCGRAGVPFLGGDGTGTLWHFFGNSGGTTTCNAHQVKPPFAHSGAGQWHRVTHRYMTRSAAGARDGIAQMWYDGTLIVSVGQGYCGVAVPGGVNTGTIKPPRWCENEDLDEMYVNEYVRRITFGSVHTYTLWPFSIDIDRVVLWRDP
jgi:hypothetical protein